MVNRTTLLTEIWALAAHNKRGVALIIALMVMSIIVTVTLEFHRSMQTHVMSTGTTSAGLKAFYAAKSGVSFALALLMEDDPEVDTLQDDWANPEIMEQISTGSMIMFDNGNFDLKIEDLSGKIPINYMTPMVQHTKSGGKPQSSTIIRWKPELRRLLTILAEKLNFDELDVNPIVGCIADWIDPDSDTAVATDNAFDFASDISAEDDYYMSLERPYHCRDGPIDGPEELLLVRHMTPKVLFGTPKQPGLKEYISVYSDDGSVNINTADVEVLASLHQDFVMNPDLADTIVEYREEADVNDLKSKTWYKTALGGDLTISDVLIKTKSSHFKITSTGHFGDTMRRVVAIAERNAAKKTVRIITTMIE